MTQRKLRDPRFQQYVDYIRNTGLIPLRVDQFDEDWEPIGPLVRRDMVAAKIIVERKFGLFLTDRISAEMAAYATDDEILMTLRR